MSSSIDKSYASIKAEFRQSGVCHVKEYFSPEQVKELADESKNLWESHSKQGFNNLRIGLRNNLGGDPVMDRIDPVADISSIFGALNKDESLVNMVETLLEEPALVLKEKLIYKSPGTRGFGLHRDQPYYQSAGVPGNEILSVVIAIDDIGSHSGPIAFYPQLRFKKTQAPIGEPRDVEISETDGTDPLIFEIHSGDMLIFDGLIPHRSSANRSTHSRRTYTITYIPARYEDGRSIYYANRFKEQKVERRHLIEDQ